MMKKIRKFAALVLTLCVLVSLAVPALAPTRRPPPPPRPGPWGAPTGAPNQIDLWGGGPGPPGATGFWAFCGLGGARNWPGPYVIATYIPPRSAYPHR